MADFSGYCSKADNLNMTLQVIDNMQNFHNFLQTQLINKQYENNFNQIPIYKLNELQLNSNQIIYELDLDKLEEQFKYSKNFQLIYLILKAFHSHNPSIRFNDESRINLRNFKIILDNFNFKIAYWFNIPATSNEIFN